MEILIGVPQGSILGPILFNFFINNLILFIQETEVCNFADDTTIYSCSQTYEETLQKLEIDTHIILNWFRINSMVANPAKFQIMFLGSKINNKNIYFNVENKVLQATSQVKLLGILIDDKLTFSNHIKTLSTTVSNRLRALSRIRKYISVEQAKRLSDAYIMSLFRYCPLIWMFCNKTSNNSINKIHKRTLRLIYQSEGENFEELLQRDNSTTIHTRNIQNLMSEIYKTIHKLNPPLMWDFFMQKESIYNLRNNFLLKLPLTTTTRYGTNSVLFKASLLWNALPNEYKCVSNLEEFNENIKLWNATTCTCFICKP